MAKLAGSIWVEGHFLHYVDANGYEWMTVGQAINPAAPGAIPGSIWIEGDQLRYITEFVAGYGTYEYGVNLYPFNPSAAAPNALTGSIWVEGSSLRWISQPYEVWHHVDVPPVTGHGDIAHVDAGGHTDTPHTNTHTDAHGNVAHSDSAHTDHTDHDDTPHTDSHTNNHGDSVHQDAHADVAGESFNDHLDCAWWLHGDAKTPYTIHFDCNSTPGGYDHSDRYHSDSAGTPSGWSSHMDDHQDHGDGTHGDSHTNVSHGDSHGDVAHKDTVAYSHQDHQDIAHSDSHTDTHSDIAHVDIAHGDSGSHSDSAHTDTHTDDPHTDAPYYLGP